MGLFDDFPLLLLLKLLPRREPFDLLGVENGVEDVEDDFLLFLRPIMKDSEDSERAMECFDDLFEALLFCAANDAKHGIASCSVFIKKQRRLDLSNFAMRNLERMFSSFSHVHSFMG